MAAIGMLSFSILYRGLSAHDVGVYVLFTSLLVLVDTSRTGFLTVGFITFFSGTARQRGQAVAGSAWYLATAITACAILLNLVVSALFSESSNEGVKLFFTYFPWVFVSTLPSLMANIVVQANRRFDKLLWLRMINQVLFIAFMSVLIYFDRLSLHTLLLSFIAANSITGIVVMGLGWTMLGSVGHADKKTFFELLHFGKFSAGTSVSANLFGVTNTFVINMFLGPAAVGIFNLGQKLTQVIEMPMLSFAASGMPSLSAHYNNGRNSEMIYTAQKMVGMLTWGLLPLVCALFIFADPIIGLLGGKEYVGTEAPNLLRVFMLAALIDPADRYFALTLDVIHKPQVNFYRIWILLVIYLIICFVGMSLFNSLYVVAAAGIVPTIISVLVSYYPLNKFINFNFWQTYAVGFAEAKSLIGNMVSNFVNRSKANP